MALLDTTSMMTAMGLNPNVTRIFNRYDQLRIGVEAAIKKWCKWEIEQQAGVVDYYDGNDSPDIILRRPYVQSVASVYLDPQGFYGQNAQGFPAASLQVAGSDWALVNDGYSDGIVGRSGLLRRLTAFLFLFPSDLVYNRQPGGLAYRRPQTWPVGYGNIKVTYTYGFAPGTIPSDIQLAVITGCAMIANSSKWGFPAQSENLGAHSYSLIVGREPEFATVRDMLSRYRDLTV